MDEVDRSAVSNRLVELSLLIPSAVSKKCGLSAELKHCEESQILLLPVEAAQCQITGKMVDKRLLLRSNLSDKLGLTRLIRRCPKTGKFGFEDELKPCQLSHVMVAPEMLRTCAVSGRQICIEYLIKSAVSDEYMLPEFSTRSVDSGAICGKHEAVECNWLQGPLLPTEADFCVLTGLMFSRKLLSVNREFSILRDLLNGRMAGSDDKDLGARLKPLRLPFLEGTQHFQCRISPKGSAIIVCATHSSWFGIKVRHVGFMIRNDSELRPIGQYVTGRRERGWWVAEKVP